MLIIELIYKKSLDAVNSLLEEHRAFLNKYYSQGLFIASGPKHPRDGGVILALGDKQTIIKIIQEDPFYRREIADYKITQFEPTKYSQLFGKIIQPQVD
jgi:uncharacterized protein YciI